jgi:hypothetical protein
MREQDDRAATERTSSRRTPASQTRDGQSGTGTPGSAAHLLHLQRTLGNAVVSRMLEEGQREAEPLQWSTVDSVLRSNGKPLDAPIRQEMESRLGADFSDVRLHTGSTAQRSATEIGARAYTSGNHVVLGSDASDKHTLAHELTHVLQQRSGPVAGTDNGDGLRVSDPSDRYEQDAEANARRVMARAAPVRRISDSIEEMVPRLTEIGSGVHYSMIAIQRASIDDTLGSLQQWFGELQQSNPQEAAQRQESYLRLGEVLREFDRWMQSLHIQYRFGGSLSALLQGAAREPQDIDVEVSNQDNMHELHNRMSVPGSGWDRRSAEEGGVCKPVHRRTVLAPGPGTRDQEQ